MAGTRKSYRFVSVAWVCTASRKQEHIKQNTERYFVAENFLVSRNEPRELENIVGRDLDVLIANFLLQVQKKDGEQYEPTLLRSFVSSFDRYPRKKYYPSTVMEGKEFRSKTNCRKKGKDTNQEVDVLYGQSLSHSSSEALINTLWLKQHTVLWIDRLPRAQGHEMGRCWEKNKSGRNSFFWDRLFVTRLTLIHD